MAVPYTFATQSGSVPASELDANFAYILANTVQTNNANVFTALQSMSGAAFNEAKGADVPSAATLNLDSVTGNYVTVSGTNTVTAVTLTSGAMRMIRATGAFTWTNNAAIVVQGGANWVASAGDIFIVRGDATAVYVLVFPASGAPVGQVPISTGVSGLGSGVATFLATPSSANLRGALTDETGTGAAVFADTPTLVTPNIGAATGTSLGLTGQVTSNNATAIPAGGSLTVGLEATSTANFGVFFGSGVPTISAAKGSLYLRSDGSTTNDRAYIATSASGTWTALTTAA